MAEVGAMHGDISTFNNVDGYLEAMFRGFRFDILKPEDYQALTQQSETLDGALPPVGHPRVAPGSHCGDPPTALPHLVYRPIRS